MDHKDVRAGIQQAKVNEDGLKVFAVQAALMAGFVGYGASSWPAGIGTFLVIIVLAFVVSRSEKASAFAALVLGIAWAVVGAIIFRDASAGAQVVVVVVAFLLGMGGNFAAFQHFSDVTKK